MRFRTYIMLFAACLWFVIGSLFMYRFTWDLSDAQYHRGALTEFIVKVVNPDLQKQGFAFKLSGTKREFGVLFKKNRNYNDFMNNLKVGDSISVYFTEWRLAENDINLQLVHMSSDKKVFIDYKNRKGRDLKLALMLWSLAALFGFGAWFFNKKRGVKAEDTEFKGLVI